MKHLNQWLGLAFLSITVLAIVSISGLSQSNYLNNDEGYIGPSSGYSGWLASKNIGSGENLTVSFIDVGQGDSILLQKSGHSMLIDAGPSEAGSVVVSYLREHGVSKLDQVLATHPDEDHIGGMADVLNAFAVDQIWDAGIPHTSQTYERLLDLIDAKDIPYGVAEQGQIIPFDPNITIQVLSPPPTHFSELNDNSIVLKIEYNQVSFLLMGDAEFEAENSLLASGVDLDADVLKVAHHGSSYSTSAAFLRAVSPEISVIQVGVNSFGHPSAQTLSALQAAGSTIFRTDLSGTIEITTDGVSYSVITEKTPPESTIFSGGSTSSGTSGASSWGNSGSGLSATIPTETQTVAYGSGQFVGSTQSNKYHYPSCRWAEKILPEDEIWFSDSADARAHGYVPCGVCHPP